MKNGLLLLVIGFLVLPGQAQELKPVPDMSSATVATAKDAEVIVLNTIMADPHDGL